MGVERSILVQSIGAALIFAICEIYQPPGPDNVLGHVKFVFPNKHDVYMHDTTMRNYYGQSYRAESHGCMRVQNPDQLALVLLKHDQGWTLGACRLGHSRQR